MMSEQQFALDKLYYSIMTPIEKISVGRNYITYGEVVDLLNKQQATIEEYEDFCLNLCKFLIGKGLVDEYREEYGKEYKIITKWKGCGSDE